MSTVERLKNYISGELLEVSGAETVPVYNPSTGELIAETPLSTEEHLNSAVAAAGKAFTTWSVTPAPARAKIMFKYRELLQDNFEELSQLITVEN